MLMFGLASFSVSTYTAASVIYTNWSRLGVNYFKLTRFFFWRLITSRIGQFLSLKLFKLYKIIRLLVLHSCALRDSHTLRSTSVAVL